MGVGVGVVEDMSEDLTQGFPAPAAMSTSTTHAKNFPRMLGNLLWALMRQKLEGSDTRFDAQS
jgi:hypothetical protein